MEWQDYRFDPDIRNNVPLLILISLCPIHKMKLHFRLSFKQFLHECPDFTFRPKVECITEENGFRRLILKSKNYISNYNRVSFHLADFIE